MAKKLTVNKVGLRKLRIWAKARGYNPPHNNRN